MAGMQITRVLGDDWEGFYVGQDLVMEGHSLNVRDIFEWLVDRALPVEAFATEEANTEWLNDVGSLPKNLCDVILAGEPYEPAE